MGKIKNLIVRNETSKEGVLFLYGDVYSDSWYEDDITPKMVIEAVSSLGDIDTLTIHLNSNGGDVFAGIAIYNYLNSLKAKVVVYVDALAASIASVIAQAASPGCLKMYNNTMMMIHDPWTVCIGNSKELRENAERLDTIRDSTIVETYLKRCKDEQAVILETMAAESWLSAQTCLEKGYCDEIVDEQSDVDFYRSSIVNKYTQVPKNVLNAKRRENDFRKEIENKIKKLDLI